MTEREFLILAFVLVQFADCWLGNVQGTALIVARASGQPPGSPAMSLLLPRFMGFAPLVVAAKWAILLAYGIRHSWIQAVAMYVAGFLIDVATPEPSSLAVRQIKKRIGTIEAAGGPASLLQGMVEEWESEGRPELYPQVRERMKEQGLRVTPREKAAKSLGCLVMNLALAAAAIYVAFFLLGGM